MKKNTWLVEVEEYKDWNKLCTTRAEARKYKQQVNRLLGNARIIRFTNTGYIR